MCMQLLNSAAYAVLYLPFGVIFKKYHKDVMHLGIGFKQKDQCGLFNHQFP
jgi:hypothetical protein